jgi:hypothetical protein
VTAAEIVMTTQWRRLKSAVTKDDVRTVGACLYGTVDGSYFKTAAKAKSVAEIRES